MDVLLFFQQFCICFPKSTGQILDFRVICLDFEYSMRLCLLIRVECFLVGDLHGDLAQARCALEMAGVLSSNGQNSWTGGDTVTLLFT